MKKMIIRTDEEIQEIRNRLNGRDSEGNKIPKEKLEDIYKDMNSRLEKTCGIQSRLYMPTKKENEQYGSL